MAETPRTPVPTAPTTGSAESFPRLLGLGIALVAGVLMPAQGRLNGQLSADLGDGTAAALISFGSGLVLLLVFTALVPSARRAVARVPQAVRQGAFPWWYMLAGALGSYLVLSQGLVVGLLGVAVFTVANVTGQTLGGLAVDATGFGPGGRRPITGIRIVGVVIMLGAVFWALSPKLGGSLEHPATLLLPMLMPLTAGILNGFQTAMNGVQTGHYRTPIPATLFNFAAGSVVLAIVWGIKVAVAGAPTGSLPSQPWLYLGGVCGIVFIACSSFLARHLGVLLTSLGMIAGQLLGSLLLDTVWPTEGTHVAVATVLGSLLAIVAVVIASVQPGTTLPWERRRR